MAATHIYVAPNTSISEDEFDHFLHQYSRRQPLEQIKLCDRLNREWSSYVCAQSSLAYRYTVVLPSGSHLRRFMPQGEMGIYAIYVRRSSLEDPACFYVGISEKDIYARLVQHLRGDIVKDYRQAFRWLEKTSEITICYGTARLTRDFDKAKSRLMLLEDCMTVMLRPDFLALAAK